jgi:hypothetical protein
MVANLRRLKKHNHFPLPAHFLFLSFHTVLSMAPARNKWNGTGGKAATFMVAL